MRTIFYSWQSDRPTGVCRNFIERALQSAIDRLRADVEIEPSLREDLELDKDTKNTPGSPAIFDTIMAKIATASVFIPDLTFVGQRENERLVSNPNVLIEYGCALRKPGPGRIIAVMNEAYGKPTGSDMPFNLAHRRFPISNALAEGASVEETKAARKVLTDSLESALRMIFSGKEYKAEEAERPPTVLDIAAIHQRELDYEDALSGIRCGDGPAKVWKNVESLFGVIKSKCSEVAVKHDFGIECAWAPEPGNVAISCVLKTPDLGVVVIWEQPFSNSLENAKLSVREFKGHLHLPGEFRGGVYFPPEMAGETRYNATLSQEFDLGWIKASGPRQEPSFISNKELADACVAKLLNMLRRRR